MAATQTGGAPKVGTNRGNAGKGRPKGSPNKTTVALKDAILNTLARAGGEDYLLTVAQTDPRTFCTLLGKVLPTQLTGEGGGPVEVVNPLDVAALTKEERDAIRRIARKVADRARDADT